MVDYMSPADDLGLISAETSGQNSADQDFADDVYLLYQIARAPDCSSRGICS